MTKIQPRILERLEAGKHEGLPAEVFVRGFVRSFARCVGLDEDEALTRYGQCAPLPAGTIPPPITPGTVTARAVADLMTAPADEPAMLGDEGRIETTEIARAPESTAETLMPPADVDLTSSESGPVANRRARRASVRDTIPPPDAYKRDRMATGTPVEAVPVVALVDPEPAIAESSEDEVVSSDALAFASFTSINVPPPDDDLVEPEPEPFVHEDPPLDLEVEPALLGESDQDVPVETWQPRMPSPPTTATSPWMLRRPARATQAPSLVAVIDDADPDRAEHAFEERRRSGKERRTFLPPILLDREDRSQRQGGLTLAVIILLIAATLTLSYLMRRPSSSGDGVTRADTAGESLLG